MTHGVGAWDSQASFSTLETYPKDTSALSLTVVTAIQASIPPHMRTLVSNVVIPLEVALSLARIGVEQRIWKKYGLTADPAGPVLTSYLAGALELTYKAMTKYPANDDQRIMVGLLGIYGNVVRLANDVIIYFVGKKLEKRKNMEITQALENK